MYQHVKELQAFLKKKDAQAALMRLPENLVAFSQYWPRYGFSFIFIPVEGEACVICPEVEEEDAKAAKLDNVRTFGDVCLQDVDPEDVVVSIIKDLAQKSGIEKGGKIAIEMGEDFMAPSYVANRIILPGDNTRNLIKKAFETEDFIPVKDGVREARTIKTPSDIEKFHFANAITHEGMDYFEALLERKGIREIDALVETEAYICKLACEKGARAARAMGQLSTGLKTVIAWADGILSDGREISEGDLALYEIGVCVDGYWTDITRTGCKGGFKGQKKEILEVVRGSFQAGVDACVDGALGGDVDKASRDYIEKAGYGKYFVHPLGHGTGFAHSEKYPLLEPGIKQVLKSNMVVAVEPGIYMEGMGAIRIEENVVVTERGGIILGR